MSDDYTAGKLIHTGLDAVHGRGRRGQRIYDADSVRLGTGGVGYVVGRSLERSRLSTVLAVLAS